jgi:hypothetical protein
MTPNPKHTLTRRIRLCIWTIAAGLFLSGITAFPIQTELGWPAYSLNSSGLFHTWFLRVYHAVEDTNLNHPYLSYGTDWLAFAHLMLAVLFAGALKDPLRNKWIIEFGIIAAVAIFPLAFIAGCIRSVPIFWRLIDCSFGVVTLCILLPCLKMINKLERLKNIF